MKHYDAASAAHTVALRWRRLPRISVTCSRGVPYRPAPSHRVSAVEF